MALFRRCARPFLGEPYRAVFRCDVSIRRNNYLIIGIVKYIRDAYFGCTVRDQDALPEELGHPCSCGIEKFLGLRVAFQVSRGQHHPPVTTDS